MGYTIETKQSVNDKSDLLKTDKCFAVIDIESRTLSAPTVYEHQAEVYFEIED